MAGYLVFALDRHFNDHRQDAAQALAACQALGTMAETLDGKLIFLIVFLRIKLIIVFP